MSSVISLTDHTFDTVVKGSDKITVIEFWATWCGPCRAMLRFIERLAESNENKLTVCKANVEECGSLTEQFGVKNLPCVIFFKDGKEIDRVVGNNQSKISSIIESL